MQCTTFTRIVQMAGIRETLNDYLHTFWTLEERIEFAKTQVQVLPDLIHVLYYTVNCTVHVYEYGCCAFLLVTSILV